MTERPDQNLNALEDENTSESHHDFADTFASILESASNMLPLAEAGDISFSVTMAAEIGMGEFRILLDELPIVAGIAISEDIGRKAAILTDEQTASALAGSTSKEEPLETDVLDEDDLASLYDTFNPVVDALSAACEAATGELLGPIESIDVTDQAARDRLVEQHAGPLCQASATVTIGQESAGQIAIVVPSTLAEGLASAESAVAPYEQIDLEPEETAGRLQSQAGREPSMDNIHLIMDIQLQLTARLGQVEMPIGDILKLAPGSVIDIDRFADEPIELVVNNRPIARGEIVVVQENFGIRITEIVSAKERIESLK